MRNQATRWCVRALAAVLAIGAGSAAAVRVNPEGLGQVLLFPYYSARTVDGAANATIISLSNLTPTAKALGVSFLEGKASVQVLGFHLFLAPAQTWVATVGQAPSGGAQIYTDSIACTATGFAPQAPGEPEPPPYRLVPGVAVPFRAGALSAGLGDGLDRTLEGHVVSTNASSHHRRQRSRVRSGTANHALSCATRLPVMPARMTDDSTTTAAR